MDLTQTIQVLKDAGILWFLLLIFAFPIGLLLMLGLVKLMKLDKLFHNYITAMNQHAAAELKIEERLKDVVEELKNIALANTDMRRYLDDKIDRLVRELNDIQRDLTIILSVAKKRESDWIRKPNTEVFRHSDRRE